MHCKNNNNNKYLSVVELQESQKKNEIWYIWLGSLSLLHNVLLYLYPIGKTTKKYTFSIVELQGSQKKKRKYGNVWLWLFIVMQNALLYLYPLKKQQQQELK